ncbi:MAG: 4-hydroxy-tetrahydrodipicolinate synthase [Opitutales bacterium]|nr:4-hydroxy-tetrahydrodipicolinate synthase [Opitutales bacterium]
MTIKEFSGVWTAIVTPMNENGKVDYGSLESLVEKQIEGGVSGIVAVGTTGESPTLTPKEHIEVIAKIHEFAAGRIPVAAGTGSNSTAESIEMTKEADEIGVEGFLIVAPYYNKPTQEGVFLHFSEIAKITEKPIILYTIPGRCGIGIENETALRLRNAYPNFIAIKEAGGKVEKVRDMYAKAQGKMNILSGDDGLTVDFMKSGAKGVVSVASNLIPAPMVELVNFCLNSEWEKAQALHDKLLPLFKDLFIEPNPVPAKYALAKAGMIASSAVRLPLCRMSDEHCIKLMQTLNTLNLI